MYYSINKCILIRHMSNIDHLGLDGNTLKTFLTVLEEGSVSRAAVRLGVSQSAVSHTLEKLRSAFDDALFIRAGRGITPTAKARSLQAPVRSILDNLKFLTHDRSFDPTTESFEFTIATNDFPLRLIFPPLFKAFDKEGINLRLDFIPSGVPRVGLLHSSRCHFIVTPAPLEDVDMIQVKLLGSRMECFYDAAVRKPPRTRKQLVQCRHIDAKFSESESSLMVLPSVDSAGLAKPTITVPNFSALPDFIRGTDLITIQLGAMSLSLLKDLDHAPLPIKTKTLDLYLVWHRRDHEDPAHRWFRQRVLGIVNSITK